MEYSGANPVAAGHEHLGKENLVNDGLPELAFVDEAGRDEMGSGTGVAAVAEE